MHIDDLGQHACLRMRRSNGSIAPRSFVNGNKPIEAIDFLAEDPRMLRHIDDPAFPSISGERDLGITGYYGDSALIEGYRSGGRLVKCTVTVILRNSVTVIHTLRRLSRSLSYGLGEPVWPTLERASIRSHTSRVEERLTTPPISTLGRATALSPTYCVFLLLGPVSDMR